MNEADTDKQLVEEVLQGRTESFNLLVWRWQRHLYNFLLRLGGDREMAQDICQEAFLRAYARLKDLREKERFASWLFRIAVNLHRSVVRRPWFQNEKQAPQVIADSPGSGPDTPAELRIFIRRLLAGLASEHREVVILKVYHGFDFQEIAAILDCPVSTVKSRLYKAFEELRQSLKDQPTA